MVSVDGGEPEALTQPDYVDSGYFHAYPQLLPDGDTVLFTVWSGAGDQLRAAVVSLAKRDWRPVLSNASGALYLPTVWSGAGDQLRAAVVSLAKRDWRPVLSNASGALYTGDLAFLSAGAERQLVARPFDEQSLTPQGTAVGVLEDVRSAVGAYRHDIAVFRTGTLAYVWGGGDGLERLVWVDRSRWTYPPTTLVFHGSLLTVNGSRSSPATARSTSSTPSARIDGRSFRRRRTRLTRLRTIAIPCGHRMGCPSRFRRIGRGVGTSTRFPRTEAVQRIPYSPNRTTSTRHPGRRTAKSLPM